MGLLVSRGQSVILDTSSRRFRGYILLKKNGRNSTGNGDGNMPENPEISSQQSPDSMYNTKNEPPTHPTSPSRSRLQELRNTKTTKPHAIQYPRPGIRGKRNETPSSEPKSCRPAQLPKSRNQTLPPAGGGRFWAERTGSSASHRPSRGHLLARTFA